MVLEITHKEKPTETNKIDDNSYMLPHLLNGTLDSEYITDSAILTALSGLTILLPVLIETKNLPPGSTTSTFSDLDGDSVEEYLIISKLNIISSGSDKMVYLKPNNTTPNFMSRLYHNDSAKVVGANAFNFWFIFSSIFSEDTSGVSYFRLYPKSGRNRQIIGTSEYLSTTHHSQQRSSGSWTNNTDNITSIVIECQSGGSMSGEIKLYKIIEITL